PAHYSGICGLKPTPGRIPATGHFPASAGPFALIGVVGPMARTVGDLEVMFAAMAGPDSGDPSSAPVPVRPCKEEEIRRMKIGWFDEDDSVPVTPETSAAVRRVAECLRADGFSVVPFKPLHRPGGLKRVRELWWNIFVRAGAMMIERDAFGRRAELSSILQEFLGIAAESPALTTDELLDTWIERDLLRGKLLAEMEDVPLFICPVCSVPAFRHGEREWQIGSVKVKYLDAMSYTQWFNILGNPAAVIPAGESPEGLPVGVQVVGRPYEEETVLAAARTVERLAGHQRKPPLE
ncbi:MAG: amidase, partial [Acidobacteriota bacterium]|nr:amidase [Acidobacteriota bacterium]